MSTAAPKSVSNKSERLTIQHAKRQALVEFGALFDARVIDVGSEYATLCLTSWSKRCVPQHVPISDWLLATTPSSKWRDPTASSKSQGPGWYVEFPRNYSANSGCNQQIQGVR